MDAKVAGWVGGGVDGSIGIGKGDRGLGRGVDLGVAQVIVAPSRAPGTLGRDLPVGLVGVRSGLEDGVLRIRVLRGAEITAVGWLVLAILACWESNSCGQRTRRSAKTGQRYRHRPPSQWRGGCMSCGLPRQSQPSQHPRATQSGGLCRKSCPQGQGREWPRGR